MRYVADLHTHSPFARGTSPQLTLENLAAWAGLKGIDLLSTGDVAHPRWLAELREKLGESDDDLFVFRGTRFILGTEVSCVYAMGGRVRRIHLLLFFPSFLTVERLMKTLARWGDLSEDGRPTLTRSAHDVTALVLDVEPRSVVMPAHAWTPWYGVFGAAGGFDSLAECFGDLTDAVLAVETGLSSDPAMNWRVPELDDKAIVSFSDAHSLPRLGREATVFDGEMTFNGLRDALAARSIVHTIEFYPEEGKYHFDGHRKCGIRWSPSETRASPTGARCPVCGRRLTIGVAHRVDDLAARPDSVALDEEGFSRDPTGVRPPFRRLVPLQEIVAEALGKGTATKAVQRTYAALVPGIGTELRVLQDAPLERIASAAGERVAEGIVRVRRGRVLVEPGYDGVYGIVSIWPDASRS